MKNRLNKEDMCVLIDGITLTNVGVLQYISKVTDYLITNELELPPSYIYSYMELINNVFKYVSKGESKHIDIIFDYIDSLDTYQWQNDSFTSELAKTQLKGLKEYLEEINTDFLKASNGLTEFPDPSFTPFFNIEISKLGYLSDIMDHDLELLYYSALNAGFEPGPGCSGSSKLLDMSRLFNDGHKVKDDLYMVVFTNNDFGKSFKDFITSTYKNYNSEILSPGMNGNFTEETLTFKDNSNDIEINVIFSVYESMTSIRVSSDLESTLEKDDHMSRLKCLKDFNTNKHNTINTILELFETFNKNLNKNK